MPGEITNIVHNYEYSKTFHTAWNPGEGHSINRYLVPQKESKKEIWQDLC